jgi:hypothetical protein
VFSRFTATMGDIEITWTPEEPFLSGNSYAVETLQKELDANAMISVTPSGPRIISIETDAAAVFTAINNLYGFTNVTYVNAPDISRLWREDAVEGELIEELNY